LTGNSMMDAMLGTLRHHDEMHTTRRLSLIIPLCLSLIALTVPGVADAAKGYVGLGIGSSWATVDKESVEFGTLDWAPTVSTWRGFAGYQINENVGIEGGYISLGEARVSTIGGHYFEARVTGLELTPIGFLPIVRAFSVFAKAGLVFWHSDISYRFASGSGTKKESGNDLSLSIGARYDFSEMFGARAEYSLYDIDKAKAGAGDYKVVLLSGMFAF